MEIKETNWKDLVEEENHGHKWKSVAIKADFDLLKVYVKINSELKDCDI